MPNASTRFPAPARLPGNTLAALFLALSFLLSLAFLAVRNTYDDEYSNLSYVGMSVPQVVHTANSTDVHPPGMYLLTNLAYRAIPSPRWMTLFTLLLLDAGLAVYLFSLAPLFPNRGAQVCFLLLAALHPQLLMWGNTIRWYGWWTGVALLTLVVALQPGARAAQPDESRDGLLPLGYARSALLGLLLAALFFLNYITLVFGAALALTLLFRYGLRAWKQYLLVLAVFCPLVYRQIHPFLTVHIPGGQGQRSNPVLSLARLVEATLCSEAYLPWHPLAIIALLVFAGLASVAVLRGWRQVREHGASAALLTPHRGLASLVLFSLLFFVLVAAAGFGVKPRNGLLLIPTLAVPFALALGTLRPRLRVAALVLLALWAGVGIGHLLLREGLTKSNMNNRPEELTRWIAAKGGADCSVVVTYDSLMALTLDESRLPRLEVLSPIASPVPVHLQAFPPSACPRIDLYRVSSYLGGMGLWGQQMQGEVNAAAPASSQTLYLSRDPDAAAKRRFTFIKGASDLPDYRYVVTVNPVSPAEFGQIEQRLPDFAPTDGRRKPASASSGPRPQTASRPPAS